MDAASLVGICIFLVISTTQIVLLSEKFLKGMAFKRYNYFVFATFVFGFIILFTPLSRIGVALIAGGLIGSLITKPVYTDFLSNFR
jgi:Zn-dependent membrane protease YugP